ncbi:MAG: hypothetical protein ABIB79_05450 [archaeon]
MVTKRVNTKVVKNFSPVHGYTYNTLYNESALQRMFKTIERRLKNK